jgi:hypothetical protein
VKVVFIVAATTANGENGGEGLPAAAGTANSLLVVEPHGRHVGEHDDLEAANVNADLHCGCDA